MSMNPYISYHKTSVAFDNKDYNRREQPEK